MNRSNKQDTGIVMDEDNVQLFHTLSDKLSGQKAAKKETKVHINHQGLTGEEYEKADRISNKPKRERTKEDDLLKKLQEQKKEREEVIRLLRNVSIRLPLLIYGAKVDLTESIKMADFITLVDEESWQEFMPKTVDKPLFRKLLKYYDEDVVSGAGLRIRRMAKAVDELPPTERVKRIAEIFSHFRNPDKETVLTPWRVVNLHLSSMVGGYCFLNEQFDSQRLAKKLQRIDTWGKEGQPMKFDAIVGNPPYQEMDGGNNASASPVYDLFVREAIGMNPHYVSVIIPARWYSGGKGLDQFRTDMLNDTHLSKIVDFTSSTDLFPTVDIAGGLCYFLWDNSHDGKCAFTNYRNGVESTATKHLNEHGTLIRYPMADSIVHKVLAHNEEKLSSMVSSRKPFGLATNVALFEEGDLTLRYNKGAGKYLRSMVNIGVELIDKWKVMISYLSAEHAGQPDKNGMFRVLSTTEILPPESICTETYLIVGAFDTEAEAINYYNYLRTRFVRFLLSLIAVSQHITRASFDFVPVQDFTEEWTDEKLYKKYELTEDEIAFIESTIRVME